MSKNISKLKYANTVWLEPLSKKDENLADAVALIHHSICLADDISDRAEHPDMVSRCLWKSIFGMSYLFKNIQAGLKIIPVLEKIYKAEVENVNFTPGENNAEAELEIWETRASLLDLYFTAWCCVEPDLDTPSNLAWFNAFKEYALIYDDCDDILSGRFEDLRQCRRNYVVLKSCGADGYFKWEEKKDFLIQEALKIKNQTKIDKPKDKRMNLYLGVENA